MRGAPLHRDTSALCGVLLEELKEDGVAILKQRLAAGALDLLTDVSLAMGSFERKQRVLDADDGLRVLRAQLHLAAELEVINEDLYLDLLQQADLIGRQLGGWLKKMKVD